jgi:taurine dioxygenase
MKVKLLGGALGAEITEIDLTGNIEQSTYRSIRGLLVEHEVIFFRNQNVTPKEQRALASSFGPLQTHPAYDTVEGFPEITILESTAESPSKIECWHSDMTFKAHPPIGTVLRSKIIPERGGDTLWSSMTKAFSALTPSFQKFLRGLDAVHDFSYGFRESLAEEGGKERLTQAVKDNPPVVHPVVRTHPESGKPLIFVNALFTTHIVGLSAEESRAILAFLYEHIKTPEFTCRFSWDVDCIAIWDNRSTQHKPINDYFPAHRRLERIVIDGNNRF